MNLRGEWKKLLLFGLFGAAGCLAGWAIGEGYLAIAKAASPGTGQGPSLISSSSPTMISSEPPAAPRDFQERLDKAGAKTGDVQMSLIWFNTNDLDLHCIDPRGFEIDWQHKQSPSGGELDVDRNAGCKNTTPEPVENIYWAKDTAPMGHYQVYVDYYRQCDLGTDLTRYRVTVLHGSKREEFSGNISKDQTGPSKKLIYEFQLAPMITVAAPQEFQITSGTKISLPVAVRRSFFHGKLNLKAENLPEGVTATVASIETGQNTGTIELKAGSSAAGKKVPIKIVATAVDSPEVHGSADLKMEVLEPPFSFIQTIIMGIWTALLAVGLCLALVIGQNRYLGRHPLASGRIPLTVVIAGAALAGLASGLIGQSLYGAFLAIGVGSLGFLIGWILLGGLLGVGVSYFVPNLDRNKAAIAGLAGGLLGAIGYLVWSNVTDGLGRFAGAAMLGFCIGLMVAIVEAAFRRVWLEVRYGERETITVNLGPEPVKIGGDTRACTVWARGAESVALRYFVRDGRVICEETPTRRESIVGNGDTRTVGTVTLIVRTGMDAALPPRMPSFPSVLTAPSEGPAATATSPNHRPAEAAPVHKPVEPIAQESRSPSARAAPAEPAPAAAASTKPPVPTPVKAAAPKPAVPAAENGPPKPAVPATGAPASPPKPPVPASRPPVPGTSGGTKPATSPKAPSSEKPSTPAATQPPTPSPPDSGSAKTVDQNACPTCGRITPGRPGARFCMMCDKTY